MRILVTGASGNLGTALLRALEGRGHEIAAVARRPPRPYSSLGASWTALDLADPRCVPGLTALVDSSDVVVNLAWAFQPMRRPEYLHHASVEILERVVAAVLRTTACRLVHVSSVAAYSPRRSDVRVGEDWGRTGIPGAVYSQLKVKAEQALEAASLDAGERVAVVRPCLVAQHAAGGPMLRCGLPAVVPSGVVGRVPVVPVDERFGIQLVHAADVADLLVRVAEQGACGAFNVATEPLIRGQDIATALGAKAVQVRQEWSRAFVAATWHAHLHPLDPGWVDMALQAPWVQSDRARALLGWSPSHDAHAVLAEVVRGMAAGAGGSTEALRPRRLTDGIWRSLAHGSTARRHAT